MRLYFNKATSLFFRELKFAFTFIHFGFCAMLSFRLKKNKNGIFWLKPANYPNSVIRLAFNATVRAKSRMLTAIKMIKLCPIFENVPYNVETVDHKNWLIFFLSSFITCFFFLGCCFDLIENKKNDLTKLLYNEIELSVGKNYIRIWFMSVLSVGIDFSWNFC